MTDEPLGEPYELGAFLPPPETPEWTPPPWPADCPEPGFYPDVCFDDYRKWPAVNSSSLKLGYQVSPKHMKAAMDGLLDSDSRARKFGRAIHTRLLEPALYKESVLIAPPCTEKIKSGDRKGQPCGKASRFIDENDNWYCGTHRKGVEAVVMEPADSITQDEAERIELAVAEVFKHDVVHLLRQHGGSEVSIVWSDDGLPAKARIDKLIIDANCPDTAVDIKKGRPCMLTDDALQRSIREYFWDGQAAWYTRGIKALRPERPKPLWAWVFIEDGPPFDCRPLWASAAMLELGRAKVQSAFDMYKWCLQTGEWPGYCSDIEELLPANWETKAFGLGG